MVVLRVVGGGPADSWPLTDGRHLIGRGSDCAIRLADPRVSRHHARLEVSGEAVRVVDLESANGLFLNGERVSDTPVRPGDQIGLGSVLLALGSAETHPVRADVVPTEVIERGRLPETPPPEDRHLQALYDIVEAAGSSLRLERLFPTVLDTLERLFAYQRCAIAGRDTTGELVVWARRPADAPGALSRTVVERVLDHREALMFDDLRGDTSIPLGDSVVGLDIRSVLCSPMVSRGELRGLVYLDRHTAHAYDLEDLVLLRSACQVIAIAVDNARLYEDLHARYRSQGEELRQVQHRLIEAERTAALGRLSRVLAHEIRNPVSVVGGLSRRLVRHAADPDLGQLATMIAAEATRLEHLLERVEGIIRLPEPTLALRPLEATVDEAVAELSAGSDALAVQVRSGLDRRPIAHDPALTRAALCALLRSEAFREAVPGTATVTVQARDPGWSLGVGAEDRVAGDANLLEFFDPFFATHPWADDIGLALAQEAMAKQGGSLRIALHPEAGAAFELLGVPPAPEGAEPLVAERSTGAAEPSGGPEGG